MNIVKRDFIYPDIQPTHYRFGSDNMGEIIREDGDWRAYLPPEEAQNRNGVESSSCYIEAQQHAIATIQEEEFGIPDSNYSARFNALLSGGSEYGGDPLKGADSIRYDGLIPEGQMPFENIQNWSEYHSWKGVSEDVCRVAGSLFNKKWKLNNYIVFERDESVEEKYRKLREALLRSPVPMSGYGWVERNGIYIKPPGTRDNHMFECFYLDEHDRPHIRDTYPPYYKILEPFYNSEFSMRWVVNKIEEKPSIFEIFISFLRSLWQKLTTRSIS